LGPSIVYSERTNEELEALFRTIINDEEFLNVCQQKFEKYNEDDLSSFTLSTNHFDYEEISRDELKPRVVHEINMSVYYNIEVDRNNSDVTYVKRYINVIPEENDHTTKKNRFSNLNLSNDIERFIKMHDYVRHSQPPETKITENKTPIKRRQIHVEPRRRTTIDQIQEYDSVALAQIVEQQLAAARHAAARNNFNPIVNQSPRVQPPVNRAKFIQPPILIPKTNEQTPRHRIDYIEFPKTNLNHFLRKPFTFIDNLVSKPIPSNNEREKLLILGQQGIISSAVALGSQRIPDNIKTIELLEIPTTKPNANQYQDFHLIGYETLDDYSVSANPILRRAKSMKHINNAPNRSLTILRDITSDNSSKLSSPLRSIKRNIHHKNDTAIHNKQVSREKRQGKKVVENKHMGICRRIRYDDCCCCCC
jgi:hypothetical protein